jgi:hypothetical protein
MIFLVGLKGDLPRHCPVEEDEEELPSSFSRACVSPRELERIEENEESEQASIKDR